MADAIRYGFMGMQNKGDFARISEDLGCDALGWGESPSQFPDPYIGMAVTAQQTSRMLMGTVVTCPGLRHPATLANTLQELQNLSDGRIFCGIGTGDLALIEMGEKPFKMDDFVEYSTVTRDLTRGREVTWNGHTFKMRTETPDKPVPFWFGADGPRGLDAAGRVADGVVVAQVGSTDVVRTVISRVQAGAEAAGGRSTISISGSCCA